MGGQAYGSGPGRWKPDYGVRDAVLEEMWADDKSHGFWKRGTTALFDVCIIQLDAEYYLCMTPEKALAMVDKEKKNLLQTCLE